MAQKHSIVTKETSLAARYGFTLAFNTIEEPVTTMVSWVNGMIWEVSPSIFWSTGSRAIKICWP